MAPVKEAGASLGMSILHYLRHTDCSLAALSPTKKVFSRRIGLLENESLFAHSAMSLSGRTYQERTF